MKLDDITIYKNISNKWVAIRSDSNEIVAYVPTITTLEKKLDKSQTTDVSLLFITDPKLPLAPYVGN